MSLSYFDLGKTATNPTFDSCRLTTHHLQSNLISHGWFNLTSSQAGHFRPASSNDNRRGRQSSRSLPTVQRSRSSDGMRQRSSLRAHAYNGHLSESSRPSSRQSLSGSSSRPGSRGAAWQRAPQPKKGNQPGRLGRKGAAAQGIFPVRPDPWAPYKEQRSMEKQAERRRQADAWAAPEVQDWLLEKEVVRQLGVGLWTGELSRYQAIGEDMRMPLAPAGALERWQLEQMASDTLGVTLSSPSQLDASSFARASGLQPDVGPPRAEDGLGAEAEAEAELPVVRTGAEAGAEPEAGLEAEPETGAEAGPEPEPESEAESEPLSDAEPEPASNVATGDGGLEGA